jgi:hypothetical protein
LRYVEWPGFRVEVVGRFIAVLALAAGLVPIAGCALDRTGLADDATDDAADAVVDDAGDAAIDDATDDTPGADADAARESEPEADADTAPDARSDAQSDAQSDADADAAAEAPPPVVARLNLDGAALDGVDFPGHWSASPVPGACGPSHYENGPVHGTLDPGLFSGEAFGNPLKCAIGGGALASGTYRVRLYFAELWWGPGCPGGGAGPGARVFSVALEGKTVLTDFDVFVATGGCLASKTSTAGTPVVQTFDVSVSDGTLDLVGTPTKDNAKLSAIEVLGPL